MNQNFRPWLLGIAVAFPLLAASLYSSLRPSVELPDVNAGSPASSRNRTITLGGIKRPASDIERRTAGSAPTDSESESKYEVDPLSQRMLAKVPLQPADANPATQLAYNAATEGSFPERLSPWVMPKPFDRSQYDAEPESYLAAHEPGRVWQSAQPGPNVPVLRVVGERQHEMRSGETVRLQVETMPKMPATFVSFDVGVFDNGLTAITVAADERGVAEAAFHANGVLGVVNILAASPVATERVHFIVYVNPFGPTEQSSGQP